MSTENKMKELNELLKARDVELNNKCATIEEMKEKEVKLCQKLEQYKVHFENLNKCIQELKDENKVIEELSRKIRELNAKLDKISNDLEQERKNNEQLKLIKNELENEIEEMKTQYSGNNSPEYLRQQITQHKEYIEEMKEEEELMKHKIRELEEHIQLHEVNFNEEGEIIYEELRLLLDYFELEFADLRTIDVAIASSNPEREPKNKGIVLCIAEMKKFIKEVKAAIAKTFTSLEQDDEGLKKELEEALIVRNDAITEITQLKDLLEVMKKKERETKNQNESLKSLLEELKVELENKTKVVNEHEKKSNIEYKEIYNYVIKMLNKYGKAVNKSFSFEIEISSQDSIMKTMKVLDGVVNKLNEQTKSLNEQLTILKEEKVNAELIQKETKEAMEELEVKSKVEKDQIETELATKQQQVIL